jgi:hypothetical protein
MLQLVRQWSSTYMSEESLTKLMYATLLDVQGSTRQTAAAEHQRLQVQLGQVAHSDAAVLSACCVPPVCCASICWLTFQRQVQLTTDRTLHDCGESCTQTINGDRQTFKLPVTLLQLKGTAPSACTGQEHWFTPATQ